MSKRDWVATALTKSDVLQELRGLRKDAMALLHHVELPDSSPERVQRLAMLRAIWPTDQPNRDHHQGFFRGIPDPAPLAATLRELADNCAAQIKALKEEGKTGRPGTPYLDDLIVSLHSIWTEAGGQRKGAYFDAWSNAPAGRFLDFVIATLSHAGETDISLDGIRKRIDKLIPKRK